MKIIVIELTGKGYNNPADQVLVKTFDSSTKAVEYVNKTNDLLSKYWTFCRIVDEGMIIDVNPH